MLLGFAVMLFYDGALAEISGTGSFLTKPQLAGFEAIAKAVGLPHRREGARLEVKLKTRQ